MAPRPMKPHDASLVAEQEKFLMRVDKCEVDRLQAEDSSATVISAELVSHDAFSAERARPG